MVAFGDEQEALRKANSTDYGLGAYVWTASLSTGMRMAKAIRSPVVVNATMPKGQGAGYAMSWEPFGQTGVAIEGGLAGIETYLRRQTIWFNHP